MIYYKTIEEIEKIEASCLIVSKALALAGSLLRPGITGKELDSQAEAFIRDYGGIPVFKGFNGFPGSLCISINEQVVHGIPSDAPIQDGDIVSIDCGVNLNGFVGDSAFTYAVGEVDPEVFELLCVTRTALHLGIEQARVGSRIGDIGFAIQDYAERQHKYGVVRELVGHGVGMSLHEPPEVPNYGKRGRGIQIKEGLVIAIEPMINLGTRQVKTLSDGWTIVSKDMKASAHYEHTLAVLAEGPRALSNHSFAEEACKNNPELQEISLKN